MLGRWGRWNGALAGIDAGVDLVYGGFDLILELLERFFQFLGMDFASIGA
jgi:hypothetical protein